MMIYTNTRSKVKTKLKPKAEREEYEAWCKKHGIDTSKKRKTSGYVNSPVVVSKPYVRETEHVSSLNSFVTGPVNTGTTRMKYTGDKMLGVAAMHKSNLVPIFSNESAVDVSTMRRN